MSDTIELIKSLKADGEKILVDLRSTLGRIEIEIKSAQRRSFDTSDFVIAEFKRLSKAVEDLAAALKYLQ